jgi:hypothetical protein
VTVTDTRTTRDYEVMNIRIPRDLHDRARRRCDIEDRSLASMVRIALRHYLDHPSNGHDADHD